jgi:hypothetical protein
MFNWSRKVSQILISRLYNQAAMGIYDDELVDEVGYALFARCKSIVSATIGFEEKRLKCPNLHCGTDIPLVNNNFSCISGFFAACLY